MEQKRSDSGRTTPNRSRHRNTSRSSSRFTTKGDNRRPTGQQVRTRRSTKSHSSVRKHRGPQDRPHARKKDDVIPELQKDVIRVIPLGGVEEIGRNMTVIEFNDDIIIVDCGFMFQEQDTPGVDYILPNTQYLEDRKEKIKAIVITHGHLDHIGGIPYISDRIGNPPIYTRRLTGVMIKKRQEEFPHLPPLDIREVETSETINVGALKLLRCHTHHSRFNGCHY